MSNKVDCYFWRLTGKEPNSLCIFLGIEEETLKSLLRACKVYIGDNDHVSKKNFELLMDQSGLDWTVFQRKGMGGDRFIKFGKKGDLILPKSMYDAPGSSLSHYPVHGRHIQYTRTKLQ
jgi:hypothetical protein